MNSNRLKRNHKTFLYFLREVYSFFFCSIHCILCGKIVHSAISICPECKEKYLDSFFNKHLHNSIKTCNKCGKELISETDICFNCRRQNIIQHKNYAIFPYMGIGQKLVAEWKNNGLRNYAYLFSTYILKFIESKPLISELPIIPVPPRPNKMKVKGWDQVYDISSFLHKHGKKIIKCIKRKDGYSQKLMSKHERMKNIKEKFYFDNAFDKRVPDSVILLDDIITTGSTISECAHILKSCGCKNIYSITIFFD